MKKLLTFLTFYTLTTFTSLSYAESTDNAHPQVKMQTNMGDIILELDRDKATLSVANFLKYTDEGLYDGTIFHRVIKNFMIQGGGFSADFIKKTTFPPIQNEANNGLKNTPGTIAMARTNAPHSATSQFFINVVDNKSLDHRAPTQQGWGYTVFGKVIKGMDVVDKIRNVSTEARSRAHQNVPKSTVLIEKVTLITTDNKKEPVKE